eukprot:scaffold12060_cov60-Phaeocystis_antarctica.AAC.1
MVVPSVPPPASPATVTSSRGTKSAACASSSACTLATLPTWLGSSVPSIAQLASSSVTRGLRPKGRLPRVALGCWPWV